MTNLQKAARVFVQASLRRSCRKLQVSLRKFSMQGSLLSVHFVSCASLFVRTSYGCKFLWASSRCIFLCAVLQACLYRLSFLSASCAVQVFVRIVFNGGGHSQCKCRRKLHIDHADPCRGRANQKPVEGREGSAYSSKRCMQLSPRVLV